MAIQREQVVQTAEKYVSRGKIEPAIREYRKLLSDNPNDINTLNRIGDLYARIQRIDEAVDFFTQIAEQYTTEGFFVKAIAIYKKIIKLDPTQLEVYEKLAELYHKQGLVNEARTQYQVLADYYQKHDNAASAIAIYQKMADLEPNNPTYHVKLAEIYQQQQLTEKAVGEYVVIAEMMIAHGRSQDAAQVYERALDIDSGNIGFVNDAVFKLKESGNAAAAARFLAIASERNPQAARISHLAHIDEPEVQAEAEPVPSEPVIEPVIQPVIEPEADETELSFAMDEEDFAAAYGSGTDLAALMAEAEAAVAPAAEPPAAEPESEEIELELDLDEVFVLDMESDDEPSSLVKPPPDMTGEGLRLGSAWAPAAEPLPAAETEAFPDVELEIEIEIEPGADLAPAWGLETFEPVELPRPDASSEIYLGLEAPDLPSLDSGAWTLEPDVQEAPPAPPAAGDIDTMDGIDVDLLERTAAGLHAAAIERDEDLVSEAEVLAKYGLEEKALERLHEALRINSHNLAAYTQMIRIHLDKERHDLVVELSNAMSRAAAETGDAQVWPRMRTDLMSAGYRLDGNFVAAGPFALMEEPAPEPVSQVAEPPAAPPVAAEPAVVPEPEPVPELEPPPATSAPAAVSPVAARKRSREIDQMLRGLLDEKPKRPVPRPDPVAPPPPPVAASATPAPPAAVAAAPEPPPPPIEPARPVLFNPLEIGEMIEREELDWEPAGADRGPGQDPPFPISPSAPPAAPVLSGAASFASSLEDTGSGSWLDEADRGRPVKDGAAERLFDDEDDFFDLAAELEQELSKKTFSIATRGCRPSSRSRRSWRGSRRASPSTSRRPTTTPTSTSASPTGRWGCWTRPSASSRSPPRTRGISCSAAPCWGSASSTRACPSWP
jgi:tetratricopeptide (TPR) repeat protein